MGVGVGVWVGGCRGRALSRAGCLCEGWALRVSTPSDSVGSRSCPEWRPHSPGLWGTSGLVSPPTPRAPRAETSEGSCRVPGWGWGGGHFLAVTVLAVHRTPERGCSLQTTSGVNSEAAMALV